VAHKLLLSGRLKFLAFTAGTIVLLVCLGFVAANIALNWQTIRTTEITSFSWLTVGFLLYLISHLSTGLAWPMAMRQIGTPIAIKDALQVGLVTQVGKYFPGNVAHYVGRGALATQFGVSIKSSGISTAIELGSAIVAMAAVAGAGLLINPKLLDMAERLPTPILVVAFLVTAVIIGGSIWLILNGAKPGQLAAPIACLAISGALSGLSLYAVGHAFGFTNLTISTAVTTFAVAWVLGLIVPGSPAGLGVREAALLAMLSPIIGSAGAIIISITHRIVTSMADMLVALAAYFWLTSSATAKK
jgi:hypothetical protein